MLDLEFPADQKYFFKLSIFSKYKIKHCIDELPLFLALHEKNSKFTSLDEEYQVFASKIEKGEIPFAAIERDLKKYFSITDFDVIDVIDDNADYDRNGNLIPRVNVHVKVPYFDTRGRIANGLHMTWAAFMQKESMPLKRALVIYSKATELASELARETAVLPLVKFEISRLSLLSSNVMDFVFTVYDGAEDHQLDCLIVVSDNLVKRTVRGRLYHEMDEAPFDGILKAHNGHKYFFDQLEKLAERENFIIKINEEVISTEVDLHEELELYLNAIGEAGDIEFEANTIEQVWEFNLLDRNALTLALERVYTVKDSEEFSYNVLYLDYPIPTFLIDDSHLGSYKDLVAYRVFLQREQAIKRNKQGILPNYLFKTEDYFYFLYLFLREQKSYRNQFSANPVNLAIECSKQNRSQWREIIKGFFTSLQKIKDSHEANKKEVSDFENLKDKVRIRIRDKEAYTDELLNAVVSIEYLPGTVSVIVLDSDEGITDVNAEYLEDWNISKEELFQQAQDNLSIENVEMTPYMLNQRTRVDIYEGQYYGASFFHLLKGDELGHYGSIISVPNSSICINAKINTLEDTNSIPSLIKSTKDAYQDKQGAITDKIYWYYKDKIEEIPYTEAENGTFKFQLPYRLFEMLHS